MSALKKDLRPEDSTVNGARNIIEKIINSMIETGDINKILSPGGDGEKGHKSGSTNRMASYYF